MLKNEGEKKMNMVYKDKDGFSYKLNSKYLYNNHDFFKKDYIKDDGSDLIISTQIFSKYTERIGLNGLGLYVYLVSLGTPNADFTFTISTKELMSLSNTSSYMIKKYIEVLREEGFIKSIEVNNSHKTNVIYTISLLEPENKYMYNPLLTKFHHHSDVDHTPGIRVSRYFTQFWSSLIGLAAVGMYIRLISLATHLGSEFERVRYIVSGLGIREIAAKGGTSVNTTRKLIKVLEDKRLLMRKKEYNSFKNVYEDIYFIKDERLNYLQVQLLPKGLQFRHEMWEHGESNWSIRKYPNKELENAFELIHNAEDKDKENGKMEKLKTIELTGKDLINENLNEFVGRIDIRFKSRNTNIQFWLENGELQSLVEDYQSIKVKHQIEGDMDFIQMICKVINERFKKDYKHVIIDDTKKESLVWEYPTSGVLITTMNWFLSLGYLICEEKGWSKKSLDDLASKYHFTYDVIRK